MVACKQLARPPEAGLNLIRHEENIILATDCGRLAQVAVRRNQDTGLALDWLHKKGRRIWRNGFTQRLGISEGNDLEA